MPRKKNVDVEDRYRQSNLPAVLSDLEQYYAGLKKECGLIRAKQIREADIETVLEMYATDLKCNLFTLVDVFKLRRRRLGELLHSEPFSKLYKEARDQRAALMLQEGYEVLRETYDTATAGESNRDAVNAARYLSSYLQSTAALISDEYKEDNYGAMSITVNVPQFSNIEPIEVKAQVVEDDDNEEP